MAAVAAFAISPSLAQAEGGQTIGTAPVVVNGIHETGDTSKGGGGEFRHGCEQFRLNRNSFWRLPVTVGDQVTIDWGAVILYSTCLTVYPIGTSDFGLQSAEPEHSTEQGSNGKQEMEFTAPASGDLILDFAATALYSGCTSCAGPYDFTSFVRHALAIELSLPSVLRTNGLVTATVTQNTGAPVPDGLSFWLQAKWYKPGEVQLYKASATTAGGTVSFRLALPTTAAYHNITFKVGHAEDPAYGKVVSNSVAGRVEPPVRRRHHRHRRHHHHHHRHHR